MRQSSENKMVQAPTTAGEVEAARRFPDTPLHKLGARMAARSRRRARNKVARVTRRANRDST